MCVCKQTVHIEHLVNIVWTNARSAHIPIRLVNTSTLTHIQNNTRFQTQTKHTHTHCMWFPLPILHAHNTCLSASHHTMSLCDEHLSQCIHFNETLVRDSSDTLDLNENTCSHASECRSSCSPTQQVSTAIVLVWSWWRRRRWWWWWWWWSSEWGECWDVVCWYDTDQSTHHQQHHISIHPLIISNHDQPTNPLVHTTHVVPMITNTHYSTQTK